MADQVADYLKGLFGGPKAAPSPATEDDFADFAGVPDPSPASIPPVTPLAATAQGALPTSGPPVVYTKWYRVWERASPSDFYTEAIILPFIILIIGLHIWGRRANKTKAKGWIAAHAPVLEKEFALVGFGGRKAPTVDDVQQSDLTVSMTSDDLAIPEELLKEKTAQDYSTYATGRQNVAFMEARITMFKRYNPATLIVEFMLSFIFDTMRAPAERMEATVYSFDGREKDLIPQRTQEQKDVVEAQAKSRSSTYDPFVFAVVHKDLMRTTREDRYDLSLTSTKDHAKLPLWATTMSESNEITEQMLTPELIKAIEKAGDAFEYLVVTDQPLDKPKTLDEFAKNRKRINLSLRLPSSSTKAAYKPTLDLFSYLIRLPDQLASHAHFRPEVTRKIRNTRDDEQKKLRKVDDDEKAEDRRLDAEKKKKEIRESRLKGMSAEEQRKFLEKERKGDSKKQEKKMSRKA